MYAVFSFKFFYNYGSFFFFRTKTICQGFLKEFMKIFKVILVTIFNLDFWMIVLLRSLLELFVQCL